MYYIVYYMHVYFMYYVLYYVLFMCYNMHYICIVLCIVHRFHSWHIICPGFFGRYPTPSPIASASPWDAVMGEATLSKTTKKNRLKTAKCGQFVVSDPSTCVDKVVANLCCLALSESGKATQPRKDCLFPLPELGLAYERREIKNNDNLSQCGAAELSGPLLWVGASQCANTITTSQGGWVPLPKFEVHK